jgi:hypothetical protein
LREKVRISSAGAILGSDDAPIRVEFVLEATSAAPKDVALTWDDACQALAALLAAEQSLRDEMAQQRAAGSLSQERIVRTEALYNNSRQRARRIAESLRFINGDREWPSALEGSQASSLDQPKAMTLSEIGQELDALRRELEVTAESLHGQPRSQRTMP